VKNQRYQPTVRAYLLVGLLFVCAAFLPGTASAAVNIPVVNPSFETLPSSFPTGGDSTGLWSAAPIPGWTNAGDSGQYQPAGVVFSTVPDGATVAYSNGPMISQTVGATVQDGVTYTLSAYLGARPDLPFTGTADLFVNGTPYLAIGTAPTAGNWSLYTATYTGTSADVGQPITIQLNAGTPQGDYDNVTLSATPEPGFYGLLALGLSGLGVFVRRRSRS
jgi:hypothetical protein